MKASLAGRGPRNAGNSRYAVSNGEIGTNGTIRDINAQIPLPPPLPADEPAAEGSHEEPEPGELYDAIVRAHRDDLQVFSWTHDDTLETLPEEFAALADQLVILHLDNSYSLTALPSFIGAFRHLRWLNVSYSRLTELPLSIGHLQSLERLYANNNRLVSLPLEMYMLKNLEEVLVENNSLKALPTGLLFLPKLKELQTDNNPFIRPEEVKGAEAADILPPLLVRAQKDRQAGGGEDGDMDGTSTFSQVGDSLRRGNNNNNNLGTSMASTSMSIRAQRAATRAGGDCANCCVRFRSYIVFITFHTVEDGPSLPYANYVCSKACEAQLRFRLAQRDATPMRGKVSEQSKGDLSKGRTPSNRLAASVNAQATTLLAGEPFVIQATKNSFSLSSNQTSSASPPNSVMSWN